MIKTKQKIGLNRDTLRKLNAGELTQARGGAFNSSYNNCSCSSGVYGGGGGFGPSKCKASCGDTDL
ncbi:MAG: hypothetical protein ABI867_08060 [Kofleriaceae bacterium]